MSKKHDKSDSIGEDPEWIVGSAAYWEAAFALAVHYMDDESYDRFKDHWMAEFETLPWPVDDDDDEPRGW